MPLMTLENWAKDKKPNYRVCRTKAHKGVTEWFFFTCAGAQAFRDGELKGIGEIQRLSKDRPQCD